MVFLNILSWAPTIRWFFLSWKLHRLLSSIKKKIGQKLPLPDSAFSHNISFSFRTFSWNSILSFESWGVRTESSCFLFDHLLTNMLYFMNMDDIKLVLRPWKATYFEILFFFKYFLIEYANATLRHCDISNLKLNYL